jgi:hypothetical protein
MELIIESSGDIRCIYAEAIDIRILGKPRVTRASHVEPDACGRWIADLTPVNGRTCFNNMAAPSGVVVFLEKFDDSS